MLKNENLIAVCNKCCETFTSEIDSIKHKCQKKILDTKAMFRILMLVSDLKCATRRRKICYRKTGLHQNSEIRWNQKSRFISN